MLDQYQRDIHYMRISVTDRCNLHCRFCMPEENYSFLPDEKLLSYEEILKVVRAVVPLGIRRFRITGGEPLMRPGIAEFIGKMKRTDGVEQVFLTTNGIRLKSQLAQLKAAGIDGVNVSLCSTDAGEYEWLTGGGKSDQALEGILECVRNGISTKVNCVPLPGMNEEHIKDVAALARDHRVDVRFIEMMPIGEGKHYQMISSDTLFAQLEAIYGKAVRTAEKRGNGPAVYYRFPDFQGNVGFISARTHAFCDQCNRVRLTADGKLKLCLNYDTGADLKKLLEENKTETELANALKACIYQKPMRHNFNDKNKNNMEDQRFMAQIGG